MQSMIFVYGTLKSDGPNFKQWVKNGDGKCHLVGMGRTVNKWPLIVASEYNVPYLLKAPHLGKHVYGEVVCADEAKIQLLDRLECHPNHYVRQCIEVELVSEAISKPTDNDCFACSQFAAGSVIVCQAYLVEDFLDHMLDEKHYDTYIDGVDGKTYVCSHNRPQGYWPAYFRSLHKMPCIGLE